MALRTRLINMALDHLGRHTVTVEVYREAAPAVSLAQLQESFDGDTPEDLQAAMQRLRQRVEAWRDRAVAEGLKQRVETSLAGLTIQEG
jgi:hypothetical protein